VTESSKPTEPADDVYRLVDIVAEEVSLVDHAANQRRFLIVKRNDPMADPQPDPPSAPEPADQAAPQPSPQPDPARDEEASVVEEIESTDDSVLDTAVAALQRLTETVETLSVLADGDAREVIGEMATELRALADELTAAVTDPEPVQAAAPNSAPTSEQVTALIASVRGALADLRPLIAGAKRGKPKPSATAAPTPQEKGQPTPAPNAAPGAASAADDPVRKEIAALAAAVAKLGDVAQAQLQRIAHLEKRFGLPNSTPAREPSATTTPEEVGWPLDLNRRLDRESVDKSVSFHD
jgi:hypothetical protein